MSEQFTREEIAKTYTGAIFLHYKGGIYRAVLDAKYTETGERLVVFEHLYPHPRSYFARPFEELFQDVMVDGESHPRFKPVGVYALAFKDRLEIYRKARG